MPAKFKLPKLRFLIPATIVYLIINFSLLIYFSRPENLSYPTAKAWQDFIVSTIPNEVNKANIHLDSSKNLLNYFIEIKKSNAPENRLVTVTQELLYQERQAVYHMQKAKDSKHDVKKQAEVLCELLENQSKILKTENYHTAEVKKFFETAQKTTDSNLSKAMDWE